MVKAAAKELWQNWITLLASLVVGLGSGGLGSYVAVQVALARHDERLETLDRDVAALRRQHEDMEAQVVENRLDLARITGLDRP